MLFSCARPYAFYGLIVLIPVILLSVRQYLNVVRQAGKIVRVSSYVPGGKRMKRFPFILITRAVFRCLAWIMLVFAYAGFSWGTYGVPAQKNGNAVAFVFDISYSMNADDAPGGLTRLRAAAKYADMLLSRMEETSVSVVLAKGDGVIAVPLTEDTAVVQSLLGTLSPSLMTASGTSLGKGIESALRSFPSDSAQVKHIWLFTDGDETDGQLQGALQDCIKYGVNVSLIGFGTEREVEITAGDGKTKVKTALRSDKLKKLASLISKIGRSTNTDMSVKYIDATEAGSALELLRPLKTDAAGSGKDLSAVSYEVKPVERYSLFLMLAVVFFVLSFLTAEFDPEHQIRFTMKRTNILLLCMCVFTLTSCSGGKIRDAGEIMRSSWAWYQKHYRSAIAGFLRAEENAARNNNAVTMQYAQYDLAATYIMQGEYTAAAGCLKHVTPAAPPQLRYAAYYNSGIIAYRNGRYQEAVDAFRSALKIDGTKIEAKENLEITRRQQLLKDARGTGGSVIPVSQNDSDTTALENAIFQRIRENDNKQWKNSESSEKLESGSDY
jgi:Tetratricopeptide repeat./von Willebrand factor type A domain.